MNVFVTGATGYIGGTVAAKLLEAGHRVTGLARNAERAALLEERGITPVVGTLDDLDVLADAAKSADATANTANADHPFAARALAEALEGSGKTLLHTSGTTIIADNANGEPSDNVFNEDMPRGPLPEKASRIATDRLVVETARRGVRTVVLCPGLVYGAGLGVARHSPQIPTFIATAKAAGIPLHVGRGLNVWSNVHVEDCADAYLAALEHGPAGAFYYLEGGADSMVDANRAVGRMLGLGEETRAMTLDEAIREWNVPMAHAMGSNVRVSADKARTVLGWTPSRPAMCDDIESGSYREAYKD
jgi:nucleoside-diphosphate-sugar epimerase